MVWMYMLMSAFHAAPWLRLITRRRHGSPRSWSGVRQIKLTSTGWPGSRQSRSAAGRQVFQPTGGQPCPIKSFHARTIHRNVVVQRSERRKTPSGEQQ
jgi:hypothetical protein